MLKPSSIRLIPLGALLACALGHQLAWSAQREPETVADRVILRTGETVLGEVKASPKPDMIEMIVRRAWAEKAVPELLARWDLEAKLSNEKARSQRKVRLAQWKDQRSKSAEDGDRILTYIEQQLEALSQPEKLSSSLMVIHLKRTDVKTQFRRQLASHRLLYLGWQCGFPTTESLPINDLKAALQVRGFDLTENSPVKISDMLPLPVETEDQWLARRAATELLHDQGLSFIETGPALIPDWSGDLAKRPGQMPDMKAFTFNMRGNRPLNSPAESFQPIAARGRVGARVTKQQTGSQLDIAGAEMTLWVRRSSGRWAPHKVISSIVKAADIKPGEVQQLQQGGNGPMSFAFSQSFTFGDFGNTQSSKRSHPNLGPAQQKSMQQVREQFNAFLEQQALDLDRPVGAR